MPERKLKIRGGAPLQGAIEIRGSKNTVLPCIAAALLTEDEVVLENVPGISDVEAMVEIAEYLGVEVARDPAGHRLSIRAKNLANIELDPELVRRLRASILLSGALISRARRAELPYPGGDKIGARPITTHLNALRALGVEIGEGEKLILEGKNLTGGVVTLEEPSVTATENTILAAVMAPRRTEIRLADASPHIQELVAMLRAMGAKIEWRDVGVIGIEGVEKLRGAKFRINPDEQEISGFAALAAATRSELTLRGVEPRYLDAILLQLRKMGVEYVLSGVDLLIQKPQKAYEGFRIQSGLYPKLMSDHLPPFAVLATQAAGETLVHEWMYEGRLKYIDELRKMGANATILDPHRAIIIGPTALHATEISSLDIRSGMTMVIAGLVAEGETVICDIGHLDRGYEKLAERLQSIGAMVEKISS